MSCTKFCIIYSTNALKINLNNTWIERKSKQLTSKLSNSRNNRKKKNNKLNNHLDYQKCLSFLYKDEEKWKSEIKTKINKKLCPDIFNNIFPELNNLREASMVDVHNICRFFDTKKSLNYIDPKTKDGYTIPPMLHIATAVKCLPFMPDENRKEDIEKIVRKYTKELDDIADQK